MIQYFKNIHFFLTPTSSTTGIPVVTVRESRFSIFAIRPNLMRGKFQDRAFSISPNDSRSTFSQPYPALFHDPSRAGFQSPKNVRIQPLDSAPMAFWNPALKSSAKSLPCGCNSASWQSQHTLDPCAPYPGKRVYLNFNTH